MKITVKADELRRKLSGAKDIAGSDLRAALYNVLIEASEDGGVTLYATDIDISMRLPLEAEVGTPGRALLMARKLYAIAGAVEGDIDIEVLKTKAKVSAGVAKYDLPVYTGDDFPTWPEVKAGQVIKPDIVKVMSAMNSVRHAVAQRPDNNPALGGYLLERTKYGLRVVSTDGHRLATRTIDLPGDGVFKTTLPAGAWAVMEKHLGEDLSVELDDTRIRLRSGGTEVLALMYEQSFPAVTEIFSQSKDHMVIVDWAALVRVVKRVKALQEGASTKFVNLGFSRAEIVIKYQDEMGSMVEALPIEGGPDTPVSFGVSTRLLADALASMAPARVVLGFTDGGSALKITPQDDVGNIRLVMPVRV